MAHNLTSQIAFDKLDSPSDLAFALESPANAQRAMLYFLQQVLNGFHSSALYALLAFGYALTHGVLHRTNIAYGSLFAFAGQTMILTAVFGYQVLWLTLPATVAFGIAVAFLYALLIGHMLARHVLGAACRELAQRDRRGDARRFDGAHRTCPDFGRHARFLAAADAVRRRSCSPTAAAFG